MAEARRPPRAAPATPRTAPDPPAAGDTGHPAVPPLAADSAGAEAVTADERLDARRERLVDELLDSVDVTNRRDLYRSIIGTVVHLAEEHTDALDLKLARAAMAEMAEAFRVFRPFRVAHKVTFFGSARTLPEDPLYVQARLLAERVAHHGWMVVTGAGPGIMAAAMEGAGRERSLGVNIRLPHEQGANEFIAQDPKLVEMRYFFTRKLMLIKESDGYAVLPGGFGTLDEAFELLTLLQTGKAQPAPLVLLDIPDGTYWRGWRALWRTRWRREASCPRGPLALPDHRRRRRGGGRDHRLLSQLPLGALGGRPPGDAPAPGAHPGAGGRAERAVPRRSS